MSEADTLLVIMGSAQDGGVPQLGMYEAGTVERTAASAAVLAGGGQALLVDASPDVRRQQRALLEYPRYAARHGNAFDGILLTHGHMGHYAGLVQFGMEAHNADLVPCWGTRRMGAFLRSNEPWARLFREGHLVFYEIAPGEPFQPIPGLQAEAVAVPHRDEYTDTVGYVITAPSGRSALYLPDIDGWSAWDAADEVVAAVDVAVLDATFFDDGEALGRLMAEVPHPYVVDTVARFEPRRDTTELILTHLNRSNPLCDDTSDQAAWVRSRGFAVAWDGMAVEL
jgi:pyrroloquinoline quinone biosynthesis protein B